jgi:fatty acid desaturase
MILTIWISLLLACPSIFVFGLYGLYLANSPLTYAVALILLAIPIAWVIVGMHIFRDVSNSSRPRRTRRRVVRRMSV